MWVRCGGGGGGGGGGGWVGGGGGGGGGGVGGHPGSELWNHTPTKVTRSCGTKKTLTDQKKRTAPARLNIQYSVLALERR